MMDPSSAKKPQGPQGLGLCRTAVSASIYFFLCYLAFGLTFSPALILFVQRSCPEVGLDAQHCKPYIDGVKNPKYDNVQRKAADLTSMYTLIGGIPQVAVCALLGCLGDAYGRKIPLLIPLIGSVLGALVLALFESWTIIFILTALSSLGGGIYAYNHAAFASLADVTRHASPRQRSLVFGIVESAIWLGLLVGPMIGGALTDLLGPQRAFFAPAAVATLNIIITCLTYCETLAPSDRQPIAWKRANPFSSLHMFLESRTTVMLGFVMLFGLTSQNGSTALVSLYVQKFANVDATIVGLLQTTSLGGSVAGLVIFMPMLVRCLSLPKIMVLSCLNGVVCWFLMATADAVWQLFAASAGLVLTALFFPVIRCGMTNTFGRSRYGESLAAVGVLEQVCATIGPSIVNAVYHSTQTSRWEVGGITVRCMALVAGAFLYLMAAVSGLLVQSIPQDSEDPAVSAKEALLG